MSNNQFPGGPNQPQGPGGPQGPGPQGPRPGGPGPQGPGPQGPGPQGQGGYGGGFPQQGYQQQGYAPQGGYGGGGYQQGPHGYGQAPQPEGKSNATIISIVLGAIAILALIGLAFALFSGDDDETPSTPEPTVSQTTEPSPEPTTEEPSPEPSPTPTETETDEPVETETPEPEPTETETETDTPEPPSGAIPIGNGMSVVPAEGFEVLEQNDNSVELRDSFGRSFIIATGRVTDPATEVVDLVDSFASSGTNPRKGEVTVHDIHDSLVVASQWAVTTVTGGGGSTDVALFGINSMRVSDNVGFASISIMHADDMTDPAVTAMIDSMLNSVLNTQVN